MSVSEAVPSIFHCRCGCFIIGNSVSHNVCIYTVHRYSMHIFSASFRIFLWFRRADVPFVVSPKSLQLLSTDLKRWWWVLTWALLKTFPIRLVGEVKKLQVFKLFVSFNQTLVCCLFFGLHMELMGKVSLLERKMLQTCLGPQVTVVWSNISSEDHHSAKGFVT